METIRLNFTGFWPGFKKDDNYFTRLLRTTYNIVISDKPDFVIYSIWEKNIQRFPCTRIFYAGEKSNPNYNECDFSFTYNYLDNPAHYRLPLYALYGPGELLIKRPEEKAEDILKSKRKFCAFVYSNSRVGRGTTVRNEFFHQLSTYKKVDSGGRYMNNIGGPVAEKTDFIKDYKFVFAFENEEEPGYTTEKIFEPMQVRSLPLYWGNPDIAKEFNPKSFLSWYDYQDAEAFMRRIIELDQNDELYLQYLREPYFHHNVVNEFVRPENVLRHFDMIFHDSSPKNFQTKPRASWLDKIFRRP